MKKSTIFQRLVLGFLLILMVVTGLGVYTSVKLGQLSRITRSISATDNEITKMANRLQDTLLTQRRFEQKYAISRDKDFYGEFLKTGEYFVADLRQLAPLADTAAKEMLLAGITSSYEIYLAKVQQEHGLITKKTSYSKEDYEDLKASLSDHIIDNLNALINESKEDTARKIDISNSIASETSHIVVILTFITIIFALLIAFFNARTINRPIKLLIKGTKDIASGHFERHLSIPSPPEIHELAEAFNHMCDRLKELDEVKADLIAHISHEFRTPLAVIREAVSLNLDAISESSTEKQRRILGIIAEECERLIISVNKVLNLSRMDAGMMDYHIDKYSIRDLVETSLLKISPILEKKQISLEKDLQEDLPYAAIDAEMIGQVLDNLLDNALKFTPEHGRVSVAASLRESARPGAEEKPGFIQVSVSDDGCGIPEENLEDIFDKFRKLHEKGTGLGLYIARRIVRAHGGEIWVESEPQKGSTFFFTVPVF